MLKEIALNAIQDLPQDATLEEILDALYIRLIVNEGFIQLKNGETTTLKDLKMEMSNW